MAPSLRELVLVTFPALAAIIGLIWYRRKRRCPGNHGVTNPPEETVKVVVGSDKLANTTRTAVASPSEKVVLVENATDDVSSTVVTGTGGKEDLNLTENDDRTVVSPTSREDIPVVCPTHNGDITTVSQTHHEEKTVVNPNDSEDDTVHSVVSPKDKTTRIVVSPTDNRNATVGIPADNEDMTLVVRTDNENRTVVSPKDNEDRTLVSRTDMAIIMATTDNEDVSLMENKYDTVVNPTDNEGRTVVIPTDNEDSALVSQTDVGDETVITQIDSGDTSVLNSRASEEITATVNVIKKDVSATDNGDKTDVVPTNDGDETVVSLMGNGHRAIISPTDVAHSTHVSSTDCMGKNNLSPTDVGDNTIVSTADNGNNTVGSPTDIEDKTKVANFMDDASETIVNAAEVAVHCTHAEGSSVIPAVTTVTEPSDVTSAQGDNCATCDGDVCSQSAGDGSHVEGAGHTSYRLADCRANGPKPTNFTDEVPCDGNVDPDVIVESVSSDLANDVQCSNVCPVGNDAEEVSDEVSAVTSVDLQSEVAARVGSPCAHSTESPTGKCSVASSNGSDSHSEMSADSGQGSLMDGVSGAESQPTLDAADLVATSEPPLDDGDEPACHEFDFPTELCGRLIGKQGKNINTMKERSGAEISVQRKPYTKEYQMVSLKGTRQQVDAALALLKQRFPTSQYPMITFSAVDVTSESPVLPQEMIQMMPEGVLLDVIVSSVVSANHVFVQQPAHPSFPLLHRQNQCMLLCYSQDGVVPQLPRPLEVGVLCAAPMFDGWFRAQIVQAYPETDECDIKFVDFGGYVSIHGSLLRQIRSDFMSIPFQAIECYLSNVVPPKDMDDFPLEATAVLEELVHGQPLQAEVVGREEDGVPYVQLYLIGSDKSGLVNRELVDRGVARWLES